MHLMQNSSKRFEHIAKEYHINSNGELMNYITECRFLQQWSHSSSILKINIKLWRGIFWLFFFNSTKMTVDINLSVSAEIEVGYTRNAKKMM